jgi:hypothetical protein
MDSTYIALERLRAEKKSPVLLWLVNIVWPGLGNLVVRQTALGVGLGILHWLCIGIAVITFGLGSILCVVNWIVASAVGQSRINKQYAEALARLEAAT